MSGKILGISGSPAPESNTDRLIKRILAESGLEPEFIKLSDASIGPCRACKRCASDNICKVNDDFPGAAEKLREADAVVLGGYIPYGMLDAFTKSFIERLWSMRHVRNLNRDKLFVTVISGLTQQGREAALHSMAVWLMMERAHHVAQLQIEGNVPCLTCGYGDDCWGSGAQRLHPGKKVSAGLCVGVEEQPVWDEASKVGGMLRRHFGGEPVELPRLTVEMPLG
ncbi:MAG: flavodoxin family protein [Synergistaceae bacterium]|jgi:multimeric flavodoxin WrbA|nr:flavodoxin family protein [Synergistaceae bacterium]